MKLLYVGFFQLFFTRHFPGTGFRQVPSGWLFWRNFLISENRDMTCHKFGVGQEENLVEIHKI